MQQRKPATGFGPSRWVLRVEVSRTAKARPEPVVAATSGGRAGHTARAMATLDLQAGEDPTVVAKRLTMKIYRMIGGDA